MMDGHSPVDYCHRPGVWRSSSPPAVFDIAVTRRPDAPRPEVVYAGWAMVKPGRGYRPPTDQAISRLFRARYRTPAPGPAGTNAPTILRCGFNLTLDDHDRRIRTPTRAAVLSCRAPAAIYTTAVAIPRLKLKCPAGWYFSWTTVENDAAAGTGDASAVPAAPNRAAE